MPNRSAARYGGRAGVAALVAILLLGLGLRGVEAWDGRAPVYDAAAYAAIARNLDAGNGFTVGPAATQPSSNYSPGLPLFVAGIYKLTGGVHERLARLVLAVLGTLAILFAYLLALRLVGPSAFGSPQGDQRQRVHGRAVVGALLAALAVAIYPTTIEYTGMLMTEPLAATLLSGSVLGILWAGDAGRGAEAASSLWRWLVPGLTLGALALVRPEYLAIGLGLAVLVLAHEHLRDRKRRLREIAAAGKGVPAWPRPLTVGLILVLGIAVVVAPWTVRNAFALDRFVTVSTGGGQVLYAGGYLPSDGNPEKVGALVAAEHRGIFGPDAAGHLRLEQILARYGEHIYPELEPDQALSKLGKAQLEDDVLDHTGRYLGFVAAKIGRIWSHGPRAVMREPVWEALHWTLLALGLLGLALLAYLRRWEALLIGAIFLAVTVISALLVASPRRVLVLIPLLAACAGFAVAWLTTLARARTARGRAEQPIP